jgi:hypothetical protein
MRGQATFAPDEELPEDEGAALADESPPDFDFDSDFDSDFESEFDEDDDSAADESLPDFDEAPDTVDEPPLRLSVR